MAELDLTGPGSRTFIVGCSRCRAVGRVCACWPMHGFRAIGQADNTHPYPQDRTRLCGSCRASDAAPAGRRYLIQRALDAGITLGLVTSTYRPNVDAIAEAAGEYLPLDRFATVVTIEDLARGKPAPDAYELALAQTGADPSTTVGSRIRQCRYSPPHRRSSRHRRTGRILDRSAHSWCGISCRVAWCQRRDRRCDRSASLWLIPTPYAAPSSATVSPWYGAPPLILASWNDLSHGSARRFSRRGSGRCQAPNTYSKCLMSTALGRLVACGTPTPRM